MMFDNGSAIEFITTNFIMPDKKMIGDGKRFIFVDNLEMFYPSNVGINNNIRKASIPIGLRRDMWQGVFWKSI